MPSRFHLGRFRRTPALPIVLYPLATPIAAVFYLGTLVASHPIWLIRPLLVAIGISLALAIGLTLLLRDKHRSGIATWALLVGLITDDVRASIVLLGVALVIVATGLIVRDRDWPRGPQITSAMSVFGGVLIVASLVAAFQGGGIQADIRELAFDFEHDGPAAVKSTRPPDIFVILLDAYPGPVAVEEAPAGSARLADALRERGFDVAAASRANYLTTRLSLPSLFNARYLDGIERLTHPGTREQDARALRLITDDSLVLKLLGSRGYERIAIASGYSEVGPVRVDRLVVPPQMTELEAAIITSTGAGDLVNLVAPWTAAEGVRARVIDSFEAAAALAEEPHERPRFVFAHVPAPHAPWVTDASGVLVPRPAAGVPFQGMIDPSLDVVARKSGYFDYATWVDGLATRTIDRILAASAAPPIVVVFSDHGPDYDFDDRDPLVHDLNVRTSNLMAVLSPRGGDSLPDDASLVNLFPYVLNRELGTDLDLQPNSFWAWPSGSSILEFVALDPSTWRAK